MAGMKGTKGEPGKPGKTGAPGEYGQTGGQGRTGFKGDKGEPGKPCSCAGGVLSAHGRLTDAPFVAFSAALANRIVNVLENTIVKYNILHTNEGRAYDMATGKFTTPIPGYYMFTYSGMTTSVKGSAYWSRLVLHGEPVISLYDKSVGEHLSSSNSVILLLKPGDEVWVELDARSSMWGDYTGYVTFSGYLIHHV
ncbi:C1q-related factor-like [Branchiostoma floridae]|nr:C1q-related factor-like [Branchiostoma floridae]